jgi:integrase
MNIQLPKTTAPRRRLRRVATGLYRSVTSCIYFAHVRIHGKLFRESLHTSDRRTAERKLADLRRAKSRIDPAAGRVTLAELCSRYEGTLGHLSKSSIKAKRGILRRLKAEWPKGAEQLITSIKTSDCETWLGRQAKRVGRSHYNACLQVLREVLTLAVRDRIIADNPVSHLTYLKREQPIHQTPSWEEFRAIVDDIRKQPFNADAQDSADFVEFIGLAGLGQAEAAALTWGDIDFERAQITTFRHKTRAGFTVPIFPQLRPLLERLKGAGAHLPSERVFAIKDAKKALAGACQRLGLPCYTHRSFRRMFITRAIEKGIDVKVIAEWQGHKDGGKLILDTYSHVNPVHSQRMAQLMADQEPENIVALSQGAA